MMFAVTFAVALLAETCCNIKWLCQGVAHSLHRSPKHQFSQSGWYLDRDLDLGEDDTN